MSDSKTGHGHRRDIDGLRAIAIIAVVAFHAFPVKVTGGFVGVDIFFVLSGYLISQGIVERLQGPGFSLVDFYIRRIGRIFPALLTVMVATLAAGWYILLPDEFRQLALHAESAAGFAQNFVLWSESGYFDNVADTKPLLHLWSLAIEEQFYIAWPIWLMVAWKARSRLFFWSSVLAVLSFAVNIYLAYVDRTADFYSPLSRFWELMIGALLAQVLSQRQAAPSAGQANWLSAIGLVAIVGTVTMFDSTTVFPGWLALLPTLGTAAIIAAGNAAWINRKLLSHPVMAWIGLVSYPLYLWHWPILSMLRIYTGEVPSGSSRVIAVALSVLLAWLTYRFIEVPIRFRMPTWRRVSLCVGTMFGIVFVSLAVTSSLLPPRNNAQGLEQIISAVGDREFPRHLKRMVVAPKGVYYLDSANTDTTLFIGDSHIEHYTPRIIQTMAKSGGASHSAVFVTAAGCPPVPNVYRSTVPCEEALRYAFEMVNRPEVKHVVIGGCWNCYFIEQHDDDFTAIRDGKTVSLQKPDGIDLALDNLEQNLKVLAASKKKIFLALDNPQGPSFNPRTLLLGSRLEQVVGAAREATVEIDQREVVLRQRLIDMAARLNIEVLDPMDMVCTGDRCTKIDADGLPIFSDDNHLRPHFVRAHAGFIDKSLFSGQVVAEH